MGTSLKNVFFSFHIIYEFINIVPCRFWFKTGCQKSSNTLGYDPLSKSSNKHPSLWQHHRCGGQHPYVVCLPFILIKWKDNHVIFTEGGCSFKEINSLNENMYKIQSLVNFYIFWRGRGGGLINDGPLLEPQTFFIDTIWPVDPTLIYVNFVFDRAKIALINICNHSHLVG